MTKEELQQLAELIDTRLAPLSSRLDGIDARLDRMDTRLDGMDARLDGIDTRLDGMDTRLDGMDTRLDGMEADIRQTRILVEEQDKKIQVIAEACSTLPAQREKLEEIDAKVDVLNDRLFAVEESSRRHRTILQELKKAE